MIIDHPVGRVWDTVRDFNSYPLWVDGVSESRIEEDLPGTTVGSSPCETTTGPRNLRGDCEDANRDQTAWGAASAGPA